jgi:hypothetical protein
MKMNWMRPPNLMWTNIFLIVAAFAALVDSFFTGPRADPGIRGGAILFVALGYRAVATKHKLPLLVFVTGVFLAIMCAVFNHGLLRPQPLVLIFPIFITLFLIVLFWGQGRRKDDFLEQTPKL